MKTNDGAPRAPLKAPWYFILLAVADGALHGSAIRRRALDLSDGQVRLWPTTLYGSLGELTDAGLLADRDAEGDDARRRHYSLTDAGRSALRDETLRLERLVTTARSIADAP